MTKTRGAGRLAMKRLFQMALAPVAFAGAAGCGGGDSGGSKTLSSGSYTISNAIVQSDACQLGTTATSLDGATLTLTVNGTTINVSGGLVWTISGSSFSGGDTGTADLNPQGIDCVLNVTSTDSGVITGKDAFDLAEDVHAEVSSGSGCASTGVTFPCTTSYSIHAAK